MVVPPFYAMNDVVFDSLAGYWILETFQQFSPASFMSPGRNNTDQVDVAAGVGVDICLDVDAALAGLLDQGDYSLLPHGAPCD